MLAGMFVPGRVAISIPRNAVLAFTAGEAVFILWCLWLERRQETGMPINSLIGQWRAEGLDVPDIDPEDGGAAARALFLLETPGPRAVISQRVSRDNPDPSARNIGAVLKAAGFARPDVLLWNVVPQYLSSADRNRNANAGQIRDAAPMTQAFINALPALRVVVFCGRRAQRQERHLSIPQGVTVFRTFHPGAMAYNRARCREHLQATFAGAFQAMGK